MEKLKEHKHQVVYTMLVVVILLLLCRGKQGRYAISTGQGGQTFILDTKTSQLWLRTTGANAYLGTNKNPMFEPISRRLKVETFEEIGIKSQASENNK